MAESQIGTVLDAVAPLTNDAALVQANQDQPRVPFQTDLRLTLAQEKKMLDHAFQMMKMLEKESGRDVTINPTWWFTAQRAPNLFMASQGLMPGNTFLGKRSRFDATFNNDVSWRPFTMGTDSIFMTSNMVVPLSRRIARQMIARAKNSFFGSDPWFSVDPAPSPALETDEAFARKVEAFCRFKLKESKSKDDKDSAIERALVLGECAVKTSYVVRDQLFDCEATVLTNVDGQPVIANDGNHITPDDQFVDSEDGLGTKVLARDKTTVVENPDAPIWQKKTLNRRQVLFEGAKSEVIYYKDFLCPLTAPDVQQAHTIVHFYDKAVMEFVDLVVKRGMVDDTADGRAGAAQKMAALITKLSNNDNAPKAAVTQDTRPGDNYYGQPVEENSGPVAEFAEFYMWYDANEDGIAENIMLIADRKNEAPIFYDHVANVTTDGLRPVEIVRINPVAGRWYGLGIMELFESNQTIVDLLVNRWNFSQSRAGRVDFFRATDTIEGDLDPNLKLNWGGIYTPKPGVKIDEILKSVYLNDIKFDQIKQMFEFFMQIAMNESGVMNANDGQSAGLESSDLATGINNIQQSGDELFAPILADLKGPLSRVLDREIEVTLANLNKEEVFTVLEGDTMGVQTLTPQDVRGLRYKVDIELTSHKNQQILQSSAAAAALVERFYLLTPEVQARVAPFYRSQLRALDPKTNADETIVPVPPAPPAPEQVKPAMSVTAKIEQLNPAERQQLMQKVGVEESTAIAAASPPPPPKAGDKPGGKKTGMSKTKGPKPKLGDAGPAGSTAFPTQLSQVNRPKTAA